MEDQEDQEPLSPGDLRYLVAEIAGGTASPEEAKRLLADFCDRVDSGAVSAADPVGLELLEFLRDRIRSFLDGRETLGGAFGLKRNRGRPRTEEQKKDDETTAAEVLRLLVRGRTLDGAVATLRTDAAEKRTGAIHRGPTQIREAWRANKEQAFTLLAIERAVAGKTWTAAEVRRLRKIYAKEHFAHDERRRLRLRQLGVRPMSEEEAARPRAKARGRRRGQPRVE